MKKIDWKETCPLFWQARAYNCSLQVICLGKNLWEARVIRGRWLASSAWGKAHTAKCGAEKMASIISTKIKSE